MHEGIDIGITESKKEREIQQSNMLKDVIKKKKLPRK